MCRLSWYFYITLLLSTLLEERLFCLFNEFLQAEDNQFGFRTALGYSQAISSARYNLPSCDIGFSDCVLSRCSLAFPSVNHYSMFSTLMQRKILIYCLAVLEFWYSNIHAAVTAVSIGKNGSQIFSWGKRGHAGLLSGPALFASNTKWRHQKRSYQTPV